MSLFAGSYNFNERLGEELYNQIFHVLVENAKRRLGFPDNHLLPREASAAVSHKERPDDETDGVRRKVDKGADQFD